MNLDSGGFGDVPDPAATRRCFFVEGYGIDMIASEMASNDISFQTS